jgi:hypothetical protein
MTRRLEYLCHWVRANGPSGRPWENEVHVECIAGKVSLGEGHEKASPLDKPRTNWARAYAKTVRVQSGTVESGCGVGERTRGTPWYLLLAPLPALPTYLSCSYPIYASCTCHIELIAPRLTLCVGSGKHADWNPVPHPSLLCRWGHLRTSELVSQCRQRDKQLENNWLAPAGLICVLQEVLSGACRSTSVSLRTLILTRTRSAAGRALAGRITRRARHISSHHPSGPVVTKMLRIPLDTEQCSDADLPRPATFASAR